MLLHLLFSFFELGIVMQQQIVVEVALLESLQQAQQLFLPIDFELSLPCLGQLAKLFLHHPLVLLLAFVAPSQLGVIMSEQFENQADQHPRLQQFLLVPLNRMDSSQGKQTYCLLHIVAQLFQNQSLQLFNRVVSLHHWMDAFLQFAFYELNGLMGKIHKELVGSRKDQPG